MRVSMLYALNVVDIAIAHLHAQSKRHGIRSRLGQKIPLGQLQIALGRWGKLRIHQHKLGRRLNHAMVRGSRCSATIVDSQERQRAIKEIHPVIWLQEERVEIRADLIRVIQGIRLRIYWE